MGKVYAAIDDKLGAWIRRQALFFVATAPSGNSGHLNLSPKGPIETLRVLGPRRVAYLDLIGSGAETTAHLRENGRIVLMLCAFEGPPRIVRLHGRGEVFQLGEPRCAELEGELDFGGVAAAEDGSRAIVVVDVDRIADSCGYGVPLMRYEGERPQQLEWIESKLRSDPNALMDYVAEKNTTSIDGLPAFETDLLPRR
jgi:hypothetical protein